MKKIKQVSVFDLDHTLLTANCSYRFGIYLYRNSFFSLPLMLRMLFNYSLFQMGILSIQRLHQSIFDILFYKREFDAIQKFLDPFLNQEFSKIQYKPAVEKLEKAKREHGHYTVILSSSPDFLVKAFAERFGVDAYKGSHYELDSQKRFLKTSTILEGYEKARYISKLIKHFSLSKEDISAYSDSFLDLPFLLAAGWPIAVNPNKKLKEFAIKNSWPII